MGLFGKKPQYIPTSRVVPPPPPPPGPSMDHALHNAEMRTGNLEARISQLDQEIVSYKREMQRARQGTSTHNMYKRRALHAMRQKKSLEARTNMSANAAFNLEQVRDAKAMQQDNLAMVDGLRAAKQDMAVGSYQVDLDEVEDLRDDVAEAVTDVNEVSEVLGRSYDVDNVDEAELEAELEELEEDSISYATGDALTTPSYLRPQEIQPYSQTSPPTSAQPHQQHQQHPQYAAPQPAQPHNPHSARPHGY